MISLFFPTLSGFNLYYFHSYSFLLLYEDVSISDPQYLFFISLKLSQMVFFLMYHSIIYLYITLLLWDTYSKYVDVAIHFTFALLFSIIKIFHNLFMDSTVDWYWAVFSLPRSLTKAAVSILVFAPLFTLARIFLEIDLMSWKASVSSPLPETNRLFSKDVVIIYMPNTACKNLCGFTCSPALGMIRCW